MAGWDHDLVPPTTTNNSLPNQCFDTVNAEKAWPGFVDIVSQDPTPNNTGVKHVWYVLKLSGVTPAENEKQLTVQFDPTTWRANFAIPGSPGEYVVWAQAQDKAGNKSDLTPVFTFKVRGDCLALPWFRALDSDVHTDGILTAP